MIESRVEYYSCEVYCIHKSSEINTKTEFFSQFVYRGIVCTFILINFEEGFCCVTLYGSVTDICGMWSPVSPQIIKTETNENYTKMKS